MVIYTTELYFESHITIEPVFDQKLEEFKQIVKDYRFKSAELMLKKRSLEQPTRSQYDTFCTGRGKDYQEIYRSTLALVETLQKRGFQVWRYKIENTLLDVKLR